MVPSVLTGQGYHRPCDCCKDLLNVTNSTRCDHVNLIQT
jgi:hypothetical protein